MSPIEHMARRVATDPFFLAYPLAEFATSERLDDAGLAAALGCKEADLPLIRLCRAPRPDPVGFRDDIAAVAGRFGIDGGTLAAAVRHGQGLAKLRAATATPAPEPGFLLAARDDDRPPAGNDP